MSLFKKSQDENKSQAELLFEAQEKKRQIFRRNVLISWVGLLVFMIVMFSGVQIKSANNTTSFSTWEFGNIIENGIEKRTRVETVLFSIPVGLPNEGFRLSTILIDGQFISDNLNFVAGGIAQTIQISILSIIFAIILALLAALGRLSSNPFIYALSTFYVSLIRGTPLYLQIFFFFLALPQLGIVLKGLTAGVIALGLNYGAYMSETF